MDNTNNNVVSTQQTLVRGPEGVHRDTLVLVARLKGRQVSSAGGDRIQIEERTPDQTIKISGFWPAMMYLDERYPEPPMFGASPLLSAVIRSLTEEVLSHMDNDLLDLMVSAPAGSRFIAGDRPTLVDVAAAVVAQGAVDHHAETTIDHWNTVHDHLVMLAATSRKAFA